MEIKSGVREFMAFVQREGRNDARYTGTAEAHPPALEAR